MAKKSWYFPFRSRFELQWSSARKWLASDRLRRVRTALFQGYILVALLAFAGLALLAAAVPTLSLDVLLTQKLQRSLPDWFTLVLVAISWPGYGIQSVAIIMTVSSILYGYGLRWEAIAAVFAAVINGAINYIIKVAVARPRPSADLVKVMEQLNSFSFPSGHVMFYTAFFGFLLFLVFALLKRSWYRFLLILALLGLVTLVGLSRMVLGEHWGSDVLGGYLLGSLTLILTVRFYQWGKLNYFVKQPIAVTGQTETHVPPEEQKEIQEALKNPVLPKKNLSKVEQKVPEAKEKADQKDTQAEKDAKAAKNNQEAIQARNDQSSTDDNPDHP